jgi:hypothetical protein
MNPNKYSLTQPPYALTNIGVTPGGTSPPGLKTEPVQVQPCATSAFRMSSGIPAALISEAIAANAPPDFAVATA